ncbi:MAG: hypothetical protein PHH59_01930 [Methylovulum sp.]|uniref:hypothetical protein n=1 Tax=Methylovulum sp. TaxID=1916980 RepID=UPI00262848D0|nr:hypothetical protein [Methylovulum sp.]MDD2722769.1 hypothetical protein [Methylovulum sp.]MDD5124567.1 hypothetical protein [Methylovulum sp.]
MLKDVCATIYANDLCQRHDIFCHKLTGAGNSSGGDGWVYSRAMGGLKRLTPVAVAL